MPAGARAGWISASRSAERPRETDDVADGAGEHVRHGTGQQDVTGVAGAGDDPADDTDTGRRQPPVVDQALVAQRVEFVDRDNVQRKAFQLQIGGLRGPAGAVLRVLLVRVVDRTEQRQLQAADEVLVVLAQ